MMVKKNDQYGIKRLFKSTWFFPLMLLVPLILLTVFKISGTSEGIYQQYIYGNSRDANLLFGHPQPIRSDEWMYTTQLTIAQSQAGYPRINKNLGRGKDMSLIGDVPYKDWSSIFKPENLAFFAIPLANAFAFKWWLLLYLLIVSCYFFTLRLFNGRKLFAALFGLAIGFTPFIFWWYES